MSVDGLIRSRKQLASGVGKTTRKNRVLPFSPLSASIPDRIGTARHLPSKATVIDLTRGFVAKLFSAPLGIHFDPYSLAIISGAYTVSNALYAVQSFATSYNVADTTLWHDTVCFFADNIYINRAKMPELGIPVAILTAPSIPYLIAGTVPGEKYGNATLNATEKRIFAVGRYQVQTWGGGGSTQTLVPTSPRADGKAMTIGPRLDPATHKAWLAQFYYTGSTWDAAAGGWAFSSAEISMMLSAAYLSKVDGSATVSLSSPTFGGAVSSSGSSWTDNTLPITPISLIGTGQVTQVATHPNGYYNGARVAYPWTGTYNAALSGDVYKSYSRQTYSASTTASVVQAGVTLTYSALNEKRIDTGYDQHYVKTQSFVFAPGYSNELGYLLQATGGGTVGWYSPIQSGPKGRGRFDNTAHSQIAGSLANKTWSDQSGVFSVRKGAEALMYVTFSRAKTSGEYAIISPNTSYYAARLANPWGDVGAGSGIGVGSYVSFYEHSSCWDPSYDAAIDAAMNAGAATTAARTYYDSEQSAGISSRAWYTAAISTANTDVQSLAWETADFVLYDAENGVYITVRGAFAGSGTAATLTVQLEIKTRHHTTNTTLAELSFTYAELLPETVSLSVGNNAIPSPKMMAVFAPLHQEQGSFKGAAYVTLAEETSGAAPAHLFNFILMLHNFSDFGTIDTSNTSTGVVHFVPVNLLEMLYAFVYSQQYGVGATRYPVTASDRYAAVQAALFSTPFDIHVRNGANAAWAATVGGNGVSLYRT